MLIDHSREKLINAIVYFAKNTNYCGKTKLIKLLYLLDFEHFRDIGRNVIGLDYYAWSMGPVPTSLFYEIDHPKTDLAQKISVEQKETQHEKRMVLIKAKADFDPKHFTDRELHLLKRLSDEFRNYKADEIVEKTHLKNDPWDRVFNKERRQNKIIPYEYALSEDEKELMQSIISENREMLNNYR